MRLVILLGLLAAACRTSGGTQNTLKHPPVDLPVVVEEDRFYLQTKTAAGTELRLFLDSAGGMFLTKHAVDRLRLPVKRVKAPADEGGEYLDTVSFPQFYDARVPRPLMDPFPVLDEEALERADGMLGAPWFANRVFTFDYAGKRLWFRSPGDVPAGSAVHRLPFGLRHDGNGAPSSAYGRIQMQVDGATLDMLFDTGATVTLTDAARQQLGGAATERATSFIIESVFDRWRTAHPDWRVIDAADKLGNAPMIEVPKLTLAGHDIGPVWFTRRPDKSFHDFMARMMDKPSDGAIGGSALHHFARVTVDWANATAVFEK
jgi:hypothetical protein